MNKKTFGLLCLCLLAGAGIGACAGISIYNHYEKQADAVMAMAEDVSEELTSEETSLTEEEEDSLLDLADELNIKYEEIRDTQIFGTTIGTIIGALVGAVASLAPSLLNRQNIKTALEEVSLAKRIVDDNKAFAEQLRKDYAITDANYNKAMKFMEDVSKTLEKTQRALIKLSEENTRISGENAELKDLLLTIFSQSGVLTALGISEEMFKKYLTSK